MLEFPAYHPYPKWVYPMWCFIGMVFTGLPLAWHLQSWNIGTCLYMIWTFIICLSYFVNSIVWMNDAIVRSPVWCDISSRLILGYAVAVPCASLCINRRLYSIAKNQQVIQTPSDVRRGIIVDLAIGIGIPVLEMIVAYIPQGHRFDIIEEIGCYPFIYSTWVAVIFVDIWPIIIGLVSAFFCISSIYHFNKHRLHMREVLSDRASNSITYHRFFRLMALAGVDVICTVPLGCFYMALNLPQLQPWKGWADTHFGFSNIDQYPSIIWRSNNFMNFSFEITRWTPIGCAILFFAFFGFADEAFKNYRSAYWYVASKLGHTKKGSSFSGTGTGAQFASDGKPYRDALERRQQKPRDILEELDLEDGTMEKSYGDRSFNERSFGDIDIKLNDVSGALKDDDDNLASPISDTSSVLTDPIISDTASSRKMSDASSISFDMPTLPQTAHTHPRVPTPSENPPSYRHSLQF